MKIAWLYWNPDRIFFTVPFIDRPVAWYGFFFVIGFIIGYFIMVKMVSLSLQYTQILTTRDIRDWNKLLHETNIHYPDYSQTSVQTIQEQNALIDFLNKKLMRTELDRRTISKTFSESIYSLHDLAHYYTDKLVIFTVIGTVIGARLGHVFFYDWPRYKDHPLEILNVWEGGLASHGGTIGVLLCVYLFFRLYQQKFPEITLLTLLDNMAVPTALVGFFIRIGNFVNQEILGTKTTVPWAIIFGNPMDGGAIVPRHPVQLYEAGCYLLSFFLLSYIWINHREKLKKGYIFGLFLVLIFGLRFIMEYFKVPMGLVIDESFLQTGQILSIPLIILGIYLMFRKQDIPSYQTTK